MQRSGHRQTDTDRVSRVDANQRPQPSRAGASETLPEGSRFGGYVVGPCIAHGGMAKIYRAEHEGLQRQVALKVLTDGFARDAEGRERFLREARISAALKHPNVVNIFDVGVHDGIPFLVMELLEGEDLEAVVHAQRALSENQIVDIMVPVVAALVAVHDAGVVHRDLKPGNIFLARGRNDETEPRLLDFGISKVSGPEHLRLTQANQGLLMGTPFYMSPEAIRGHEMTILSDQYSLGVVLYECATGINPFSADNFAETVRRVTTGDFPSPAVHNPRLSKRLVRIIERATSLEPQHRFEDFRELGRELLALAGQRTRINWGLSFGDIALEPRRTAVGLMAAAAVGPGQEHRQPPRAHWTALAALTFGMLTLGSVLAVLWVRSTERPSVTGGIVNSVPVVPQLAEPTQTVTLSLRPASVTKQADAPPSIAPPAEVAAPASGLALPAEVAGQPLPDEPGLERAPRPARPKKLSKASASKRAAARNQPDWSVAPPVIRPLEARPERVPMGTNAAPIFR